MAYEKRLIEGNFPCQQVGAETRRERSTGLSPAPNRLHVWWARRPLTASRASVLGSILPADVDAEEFLKELGIKKYQVLIGDTWVDIPETMSEKIINGKLLYSKEVEKAIVSEKKLRKELQVICDSLKVADPSIIQNKDFLLLEERAKEFEDAYIPAGSCLEAKELAADPAWFNRIMELCADSQIRVQNLYGYNRAYKSAPGKSYSNITVLDPTSGGGAIPFEALRLGCNVIANDLNPVASAIEIATLKYPSLYGLDLYKSLEKYGRQMLDAVSIKMKPCFWSGKTEEVMS